MKQILLSLLFLLATPTVVLAEEAGMEIVSFKLTTENGLPDNNIRMIIQDSLGYLYFKGLYGTYRYDGYQFRTLSKEKENRVNFKHHQTGNRIHDVFRDNLGNRIELKSNGDLLYTDKRTGEESTIHIVPPKRYQLTLQLKCTVITDQRGLVWISTNGHGIYLYNKKDKKLRHITKDDPERLIHSNYIVCMMQDVDGNIWVASEHHGVARLKISQQDYTVLNLNASSDEKGNEVRMLTRLSDGRLLIADMAGNLRESTDELKTTKSIYSNEENYISACIDNLQRLWLGSRLHGIKVNDKHYGDGRTDCIVKDPKGRMWICGLRSCLRQVSVENDQYHERRFMEDIKGLDPRVLLVDHRGDIWMGTRQGLYVFNPDRLLKNGKDYEKVMDTPVMCLYESSEKYIWVGTVGQGAFYGYNKQQSVRTFTQVSTKEGLAHNVVQLISEDKKKNLCLGTEDGCSFVNPFRRKIFNLNFSDSRLRNIFNERCVVQLADGRMAFGTLDGIVITRKIMEESRHHHPLLITGIEVNSLPLADVTDYTGDVSQLKEVTLNSDENSIEVNFSNLNYGENSQTIYHCWLEGFDREWVNLGKVSATTYKQLKPGTYTLHIRSMEIGVGGEGDECSMTFIIRPPLWRTWWAFVIYALLLVTVGFFVYKYLWDIYRLRRDIEVERQLTDYKLKFFTNISHEFRTPLTLIQCAMEKIREAGEIPASLRQPVSNMHHSVERMMRLINQLLEFRRMQNNKLTLSLQKTDLIALLRDIYMNFHEVAELRRISYQFTTTEKTLDIYVDREHIDKIVYNLLSNAFKYTPFHGTIDLKVRTRDDKVVITVEDSGVGIPKDRQEDIFRRYTTGKVKSDSIGIGLNLTQELVHVHHGTISYEENTPAGSIFTVVLPTDKGVYQPEDFLQAATLLTAEEETDGRKGYEVKYRENATQPLNACTALLVEDDADVAEMLARELGHYFTVMTANDGQEALDLLRSEEVSIDLVVSDVMMPRMNGFELTKVIRGDQRLQQLPVVLLTALSSEDKQQRGMDVGADVYISKPFSLRLLVAQCVNLLNQRQRLKTAYATMPQQKESIPEIIKEEKDRKFIDQLDMFIYNHIADFDLSVDMMAEHFRMGRTSFYNKVRALTGITPNEYLKDIRLRKAAEMLKDDDFNVSEVCYRVGIGNPQYFATTFKKKFGISPKEYQKGK